MPPALPFIGKFRIAGGEPWTQASETGSSSSRSGLAQSGQAGVIEEVLSQDPQRFRVLWDDGHTSVLRSLGWRREDRTAREGTR